MRIGLPLSPDDYGGSKRRRRQQLTGDLMEAIRSLSGQPVSPDFASDEPPVVRGGSESVYEVFRVVGESKLDWQRAVGRGVTDACERWDDARVGEVKALRCTIDEGGRMSFVAEVSVSIKVRDGSLQSRAVDTSISTSTLGGTVSSESGAPVGAQVSIAEPVIDLTAHELELKEKQP